MGLSVIIITKNEAKDLPRALASVSFAHELIVLDSGSTDGTQEIAESFGAKVFESPEWPGFGTQKNRALSKASQEWVLSLDADEWIEADLAEEIVQIVRSVARQSSGRNAPVAFRMRRRSIFIDRVIRFGDWRRDRVTRLFLRDRARFTDDAVHERLIVQGGVVELRGLMGHHSVRSISDSRDKMWQYNRIAANKIAEEGRGGRLKGFAKAFFSLVRGLVFRLGFLDGRRGFQLAWFNAHGTYLRYALAQSLQDQAAYQSETQTPFQRFRDVLHLVFVDHGFLRTVYENRFRLAGGLYRVNQPSPSRLAAYKRNLGVRTVVNLRGRNEQLGWYRLEERACRDLGLQLINTQVYSRGLVDRSRLEELKEIIENLELPAVVHCKSGADRAGFFSVLYRHFRLGEPIEIAISELGLRYGHSSSAKTGVLDFFFRTYLESRESREGFHNWSQFKFDRDLLQEGFRPRGFASWCVDYVLRRE